MPNVITYRQLVKAGACTEQTALFKSRFGAEVEVSEALAMEVADLFDWGWAAQNLLSSAGGAEYRRVMAQALAEYKRVRAPARAEYERVRAPAWAEYERVRDPALAEYERVRALAFVRLYLAE